jgi:hypothetical protein
MTDRKKVDIAIFECSEENEVENLRQVVICPPFQKVGKEGRHQDPRRRTRKDNQRLSADCDGVCDLVLRSDSKSVGLGLSVFTSTFPSLVVRFKRIATLGAERAAASRYLTR